jgi:hypothetical protein
MHENGNYPVNEFSYYSSVRYERIYQLQVSSLNSRKDIHIHIWIHKMPFLPQNLPLFRMVNDFELLKQFLLLIFQFCMGNSNV